MSNREYLDSIRQKNKEKMSKCYYCDGFAISINAEGYSIRPVCKNHDARSLDDIEKDME